MFVKCGNFNRRAELVVFISGLPEPNVGILSEEFMDRLAALPPKNLALETLRELLNDQIRSRESVNIVRRAPSASLSTRR